MSSKMESEPVSRTADVEIAENIPFSKMLLSDHVLAGLKKCNFMHPSPIQLRAIPIGCCGLDLLIKAKSGTGKTLVFCTIILERYQSNIKAPQSLVVVPTREIAEQIKCYLNDIGEMSTGFKAASFIGGRDIGDDRKAIASCRSVVGTPGRLLHLIANNVLCMDHVKLFVLDEADKMLQSNFQSDVKKLIHKLPAKSVQMIASSATFSDETNRILRTMMQNPVGVTPSRDAPILLGVKQYKFSLDADEEWLTTEKHSVSIRTMTAKVDAMKVIFSSLSFKQAIVFSNSQMRTESYCKYLIKSGWKADVISGLHEQSVRLATFQRFKLFETRILFATDLMARGIDVENIDLVINLDVPTESATYLHRIGRCGRFGSQGIAITILSSQLELQKFDKMLADIGGDRLNVMEFSKKKEAEDTNENCELETNISADNCTDNQDEWHENESADWSNDNEAFHSAKNAKTSKSNGRRASNRRWNSPLDIEAKNRQLLKLTELMIEQPKLSTENIILPDLFQSYTKSSKVSTNGLATTSPTIEANNIGLDNDLFGAYKSEVTTRTIDIPVIGNNHQDGTHSMSSAASYEYRNSSDGDSVQLVNSDAPHFLKKIHFNSNQKELQSSLSPSEEAITENDSDSDSDEYDAVANGGDIETESDELHSIDGDEYDAAAAATAKHQTNKQFLDAILNMHIDDKTNVERIHDKSAQYIAGLSSSEPQPDVKPIRRNKHKLASNVKGASNPAQQYSSSYFDRPFANWTSNYWNQINQIQRYVGFVRQQRFYSNNYY